MNVVPAQVAGVAVAGRGLARRRRTSAACPHPTILAACALLGRRRGLRRRWCAGDRDVRVRRRGVPARRPRHRPGQRLRRRRRSGCSRASSASTPRPARPRSRSSPTTRADPAHVAADLISQAEHDPLGGRRARHRQRGARRRGRGRARRLQVAATKHVERITRRAGRPAVGDRPRRRPRRPGLRVVDAYAAEHLEIQTRDAAAVASGCATPVRSSSAPSRPSPSATTAPAPTTCCRPVAAPATAAGCRCSPSCAASTSSTTTPPRCAPSRPGRRARQRRGPPRPRRRRHRPLPADADPSRVATPAVRSADGGDPLLRRPSTLAG